MYAPDYTQSAEDHQTLLILVKQIGNQISQKSFSKIFERIGRIQQVKIQESGGQRYIWLRYKKNYPVEWNDWGDFQAHRKVLGLLSVGKYCNQSDVEELCKEHISLQEKYSCTLYDSRCLAFGADALSPSASSIGSSGVLQDDDNLVSPQSLQSPCLGDAADEVFRDSVEPVPKSHVPADDTDSGMYEQSYSLQDSSNSLVNGPKDTSSPVNSLIEDSLPNVNTAETSKQCDSKESLVNRDFSLNSLGSASSSSDSPSAEGNSPSGSRKLMIPPKVKSRSTHCILYPGTDNCDQLEQDVNEFICSLFWVLESKRLDRSFEKQDKIPLLTASFEKRDFVGIDTDTRIYKKRCLGRMKKHIGDLALQAGLPLEALVLYSSSFELLKAVHDWLWLASTYEGQCAASIVLLYPPQNRNPPLQRNSSFPVGSQLTKAKGVMVNNHSKSLPNGIDPVDFKNLGKNILSVDDIVEKYKEAILHYRKYQSAAVIEVECSIKATKILTMQEKYLDASEFLQNVVFTTLQQTDEEKFQCQSDVEFFADVQHFVKELYGIFSQMHRFNALSQLYTEIGFHRKASFFKRVAAMRCVSQANQSPNWVQCYFFLLQSLEGYKLSLDPKEFPKNIMYGWPGIQIQIIHDLVGIAKHMNNQALAVRHMTFLLHTLSKYLTPSEQQEFCSQLETLTAKCEGAPVPLALDNGLIIPAVNLLNLPRVKSFKLQNLAPHLRPVLICSRQPKKEPDPRETIFIFSPIPRDRDRAPKETNKLDFKWVEGDVCEVAIQLFNPLPFELKVTHMGLQADGIAFESFPACLSLPAESGPYPVNLLGTPLGTGELQILGYTTHVLGVKSNCRLRDIPAISRPFFAIDVIPKLPQIQMSTSLPKASTFSSLGDTSYVVVSAAVTMYAGESQECTITLTNTGKESVDWVDISLHTKLDKAKEIAFFTWSKENLETQLPIAVGSSASFTLYINAVGDFVCPVKNNPESSAMNQSNLKGSRPSSASSLTGTPNRRKPPVVFSPEPFPPKTVEAVLQLQYSGGPGMAAKYCRQCAVAINVEVMPSVVITKWDVLPAEFPTHCYLVLDILNTTAHEMEVQYASNKRILIEARDTCRIPVPVERCPLTVPPTTTDKLDSHSFNENDKHKKLSLEAACRDHLVNLVDLQWSISLEISGKASVADITWTDTMLDAILMSPIQFEIALNGRLFKVEEEFSFIVGELITLSITLRNLSDIALHSLHLCIRGYQDHQNGHHNYRLETKRAVIGSDKIFIKDILAHEDFCHDCGFVFFHTGIYKLDIQCSSKEHQGIWPRAAQSQSQELRSMDRGASHQRLSLDSDHSSHVWKCTPSIDICIIED